MAAVAPRKGLGDAENAAPPGSCLYKKKIRLHLFCCFKQEILYRQFTNGFTGMRSTLVQEIYVATYATSSGYASSAGSVSGAAIIDAASSGNPSYIRFTNGFKIMTGVAGVSARRTVTVSFPIAFSTNNFGASCTSGIVSTGNGTQSCTASTTTITISNGTEAGASVHWMASGY